LRHHPKFVKDLKNYGEGEHGEVIYESDPILSQFAPRQVFNQKAGSWASPRLGVFFNTKRKGSVNGFEKSPYQSEYAHVNHSRHAFI
jgi:hypothetical protein